MNAQCTIFAESEVVGLIHAKTAVNDISKAIHDSMASRIASMIRRVGVNPDVALIGKTMGPWTLGYHVFGVQDFLLRDEETRLRLYLTRRTRGGLSIAPRHLWEMRIDERSRVRIPAVPGRTEILVLEPEQVLHVRFP